MGFFAFIGEQSGMTELTNLVLGLRSRVDFKVENGLHEF